jgi:flagellar hook-length control protein FliK
MNPLRTDPQSFQLPLPASRTSGPARNDSGDAFAQILDQHLTARSDPSNPPRSQPSARSDDEAPGDREAAETKSRPRYAVGRRHDDKKQATKPAEDSAAAAKKKDAKSANQKPGSSEAATGKSPQKTPAKTQPDDSKPSPDAATAQPAAAESNAGNAAPDADGKSPSDGNPDAQQQSDGSGDSGDKSSSKQQGGDTATVSDANPALIQASAQNIGIDGIAILKLTGVPTAPTAAGKPIPASAQAGLLAAGGQNPVLQALEDLSVDAGDPVDGQAGDIVAAGLKFGVVIPKGRNAQGQQDAASAAPDATDPFTGDPDTVPESLNSANTAISAAAKGKTLPDSNHSQTSGDKSPNTNGQPTAPAPVAADQSGKTPAFALSFPGNRPNATVSRAALDNDLSARFTVSGDDAAAGDAELSAFSQYLGPNVANSMEQANALRQSSFMTELKQSLQALPPHEQISVQIQNAMQNGTSRMTVDLQPAELGRVEIKLDVDKDKNVSATIVADRPATLDLLQRDAKALERALQQAGLQTDSGSLSFSLRDTGGQGQGGQGQGGNGKAGGKGSDGNAGAAASGPAKSDVVALANGYVDLET